MNNFVRVLLISLCFLSPRALSALITDITVYGNTYTVTAFETAETGASFYGYNSPIGSSANIEQIGTLADQALQLFVHLNTLNNEVSLGVIFEAPSNIDGGSFTGSATVASGVYLALSDDPNEVTQPGGAGTQVNINMAWLTCCTDGFVLSGFDPNDISLDLTGTLNGITDLILYSANEEDTVIPISQTGEIDLSTATSVNEPEVMWLAALMALILFTSRKKHQVST